MVKFVINQKARCNSGNQKKEEKWKTNYIECGSRDKHERSRSRKWSTGGKRSTESIMILWNRTNRIVGFFSSVFSK